MYEKFMELKNNFWNTIAKFALRRVHRIYADTEIEFAQLWRRSNFGSIKEKIERLNNEMTYYITSCAEVDRLKKEGKI